MRAFLRTLKYRLIIVWERAFPFGDAPPNFEKGFRYFKQQMAWIDAGTGRQIRTTTYYKYAPDGAVYNACRFTRNRWTQRLHEDFRMDKFLASTGESPQGTVTTIGEISPIA